MSLSDTAAEAFVWAGTALITLGIIALVIHWPVITLSVFFGWGIIWRWIDEACMAKAKRDTERDIECSNSH